MQRLGLLLALLFLSFAYSADVRADTGWSGDLSRIRNAPRAEPARPAVLAPRPPSGPYTLLAADGSSPKILLERGDRDRSLSQEVAFDEPTGYDPAGSRPAAQSRIRAVVLRFLHVAPSRAIATLGVIGVHTSPPPPLLA